MLSADSLWPDLDLNCLTLTVFLKDFFSERDNFEKNQQMTKKHKKITQKTEAISDTSSTMALVLGS